MTRLLAAAAVASVLCGLASLTPASAGNGGRVCVGTGDGRYPGYAQAICVNDPFPHL